MKTQTIAEALASALQARINCEQSGNTEWQQRHGERIAELMETAPSGSGIDTGTTLDDEKANPEKLSFYLSYHHMNDGGMYDGWTEHTVTARASLVFGLDVRIGGRDRNDIKDYLGEVYQEWLASEAPEIKPTS